MTTLVSRVRFGRGAACVALPGMAFDSAARLLSDPGPFSRSCLERPGLVFPDQCKRQPARTAAEGENAQLAAGSLCQSARPRAPSITAEPGPAMCGAHASRAIRGPPSPA